MIELTKSELEALVFTMTHYGELKVGKNSPDGYDSIEIAESLAEKGFFVKIKSPAKRRTWYVYRTTKNGFNHLIELEKQGYMFFEKEGIRKTIGIDELKIKFNTGTLTYEEFKEHNEQIFSIIKERFFKFIKKGDFVIFTDRHNNPIKRNKKNTKKLIETMSQYATGDVSGVDLFRCMFELGMCMDVAIMFQQLLHDSILLKDIRDKQMENLLDTEVEHISKLDKTKIN